MNFDISVGILKIIRENPAICACAGVDRQKMLNFQPFSILNSFSRLSSPFRWSTVSFADRPCDLCSNFKLVSFARSRYSIVLPWKL